jgi:site-specific recombinase XerD
MEIISLIRFFREKLVVQRYSISSVKNYCSAIQHFLKIASHKYSDPSDISQDDIEKFIFWEIKKHNISASHQTTEL